MKRTSAREMHPAAGVGDLVGADDIDAGRHAMLDGQRPLLVVAGDGVGEERVVEIEANGLERLARALHQQLAGLRRFDDANENARFGGLFGARGLDVGKNGRFGRRRGGDRRGRGLRGFARQGTASRRRRHAASEAGCEGCGEGQAAAARSLAPGRWLRQRAAGGRVVRRASASRRRRRSASATAEASAAAQRRRLRPFADGEGVGMRRRARRGGGHGRGRTQRRWMRMRPFRHDGHGGGLRLRERLAVGDDGEHQLMRADGQGRRHEHELAALVGRHLVDGLGVDAKLDHRLWRPVSGDDQIAARLQPNNVEHRRLGRRSASGPARASPRGWASALAGRRSPPWVAAAVGEAAGDGAALCTATGVGDGVGAGENRLGWKSAYPPSAPSTTTTAAPVQYKKRVIGGAFPRVPVYA